MEIILLIFLVISLLGNGYLAYKFGVANTKTEVVKEEESVVKELTEEDKQKKQQIQDDLVEISNYNVDTATKRGVKIDG